MDLEVDANSLIRMGHRYSVVAPIIASEVDIAMTRSALAVEGTAKHIVRQKTHTLQRSITHEVRHSGGYTIGVVGTNVPYSKIVEEGSKPHIIRPKNKRALYWKGARHPVMSVNHPGTRPYPYLRPAIVANRAGITREFAQVNKRALRRLAAS